jgi:hypothetical protein
MGQKISVIFAPDPVSAPSVLKRIEVARAFESLAALRRYKEPEASALTAAVLEYITVERRHIIIHLFKDLEKPLDSSQAMRLHVEHVRRSRSEAEKNALKTVRDAFYDNRGLRAVPSEDAADETVEGPESTGGQVHRIECVRACPPRREPGSGGK